MIFQLIKLQLSRLLNSLQVEIQIFNILKGFVL